LTQQKVINMLGIYSRSVNKNIQILTKSHFLHPQTIFGYLSTNLFGAFLLYNPSKSKGENRK